MRNFLKVILSFAAFAGATAPVAAQQLQPDGTLLIGGIRLNAKAPPPERQRSECRNAVTRTLGQVAMTAYGVEPWIKNHPLLERNCVTLLDIPPVSGAPQRDEMMRASASWWSRVVRVRFPENHYGWTEGFGFAWCATQSCTRNVLILFSESELIGFCSAQPEGRRGTRVTVASQLPLDEAWTKEFPYFSCLGDPREVTSRIVSAANAPGATKFVAPRVTRDSDEPGRSNARDQFDAMIQSQASRDQAARDAARQAAERAQADAAWQRLQQPNALGW